MIAADGADAATDLVGQGLEGETAIGGCESAGEPIAEAVRGLSGEKDTDGFFIASIEKAFDAGVGNERPGGCAFGTERKMEAVDRVEEEERANTVVEILAGMAV